MIHPRILLCNLRTYPRFRSVLAQYLAGRPWKDIATAEGRSVKRVVQILKEGMTPEAWEYVKRFRNMTLKYGAGK